MQDLSYPKTSLGLNIIRHENRSNSINQNGYIDRILARFQISDAISVKVLLIHRYLS